MYNAVHNSFVSDDAVEGNIRVDDDHPAGSNSTSYLSINSLLETIVNFIEGSCRLASKALLFSEHEFLTQVKHSFSTFKGLNTHDNKVALAVSCDVDGLGFVPGEFCNGVIVIP